MTHLPASFAYAVTPTVVPNTAMPVEVGPFTATPSQLMPGMTTSTLRGTTNGRLLQNSPTPTASFGPLRSSTSTEGTSS